MCWACGIGGTGRHWMGMCWTWMMGGVCRTSGIQYAYTTHCTLLSDHITLQCCTGRLYDGDNDTAVDSDNDTAVDSDNDTAVDSDNDTVVDIDT